MQAQELQDPQELQDQINTAAWLVVLKWSGRIEYEESLETFLNELVDAMDAMDRWTSV